MNNLSPKTEVVDGQMTVLNLLSSTCQVSSERECSDLESEVPGSVLTVGNILLLDFFCFQLVKPLMPILSVSSSLWKAQKRRSKDISSSHFVSKK